MANWPDHDIDTQWLDANSDSTTEAREDLLDAVVELNRIINARGATGGIASLSDQGFVPSTQLSGAEIITALAPVDGLTSGLDADLLQGIPGEDYALLDGSRQYATTNSVGHDFSSRSSSPAIVRVALRVGHVVTSGTPAVGMGTAIRYVIGAIGGLGTAAHAEAGWLDPNLGTLTSRFSILTMESLTFLEQVRWNYGYQEMRQIVTPGAPLNAGRARFWFETDGMYYQLEGAAAVGPLVDASGAGTDHGTLSGLLDDDHTIYMLVDGTRAFTGTVQTGAFPILMTEIVTPSTPATGKWSLYFKTGGLYMLDDAGLETSVAQAGGIIDHQTTTNRTDPAAHVQYVLLEPGGNQVINPALGDYDFTFNGDNVSNLLKIDAGLDRLFVNTTGGVLTYEGWLNVKADAQHGVSVRVNDAAKFGIISEALAGTAIYAISNGFGATALAAGRFADSASATFEVLDAMGGTLGSPLARIRPYPASQGTFFEINTNLLDRLVQVQHDNFYVNRDLNNDFDFRVYGGTLTNLLVVNSGNDKVTINGDSTNARFNVIGGAVNAAYFLATGGQTAISTNAESGSAIIATATTGIGIMAVSSSAGQAGYFARQDASLSALNEAALTVEIAEVLDVAPALKIIHGGTGQIARFESVSSLLWSFEIGGEMNWKQRASDPAGNPAAGYDFLYYKTDGQLYDKDSSGNVRQYPAGLGTANGDYFSWDGTEWVVTAAGAFGAGSGVISGANGTQITTLIDVYTVTNPTGASQLVGGGYPVLPRGDTLAVLIRVNSTVGGCESIDIGTEDDPTAWGEAISPVGGTTTTVGDFHGDGPLRITGSVLVGGPPVLTPGAHLYLRARGANFNGTGTIRVAVYKRTFTGPTS